VALGAILDVDAIIFSAMMPKKLQLKVQDLEAIKVQYSRLRSQMESVCIILIVGALLAWPWFTIVGPLGETMEAVKHAHCGGNQDFVVGLNEDQKMPFGFKSVPFNSSAEQTLVQLAIGDYLFQDGEAKYIAFHTDPRRFESYRTQTTTAAASENAWCADVDQSFSADSDYASQASYFLPFYRAAILGLGLPSNSSCADALHRCDDEDSQLLRLVCGRTCCINSRSNPWFKVPAKGCPVPCLEEADQKGECTNQVNLPAWDQFWDLYPTVLGAELGQTLDSADNSTLAVGVYQMIDAMKSYGCVALSWNGLQNEVVSARSWCGGNEELFAPLARLCPATCGCTNLTDPSQAPAGCPAFCECKDLPFAPIGPVASCADGLAAGWCVAAEFVELCPKTCGGC